MNPMKEKTQRDAATAEAVAREALRQRGLCTSGVRLLRFGSNGLFHSPANDLVIRVSREHTTTGFRFAALLAARGFDVLAPILTDAPELLGAFEVSYWPYCQEVSDDVDFRHLGAIIRQVHDATPWLAPALGFPELSASHLKNTQLQKMTGRFARLSQRTIASKSEIAVLRTIYEELTEAWNGATWRDLSVLHAGTHPGNVLVTQSKQYLLDFDRVCTGWRYGLTFPC